MAAKRSRLDRFISSKLRVKRGDVRLMLARGIVTVDGITARDIHQQVNEFSTVVCDNTVLQENTARYLMLYKPAGVVSATKDLEHPTVMDLLGGESSSGLHIAGRLDLHSTGLLLLTNNGEWSSALSLPQNNVEKIYRVEVAKPITDDYVTAFAAGMYFAYEDITTRPVTLRIVSEYVAELRLVEGRYHQIKRMFGRFRNPVVSLHRVSIGPVCLDENLQPGESRELTDKEIHLTSF
ncbi:16S rRNA pseudouridine(516) synthase [Gammaproteobacteria bacterium 45_16_T64]|nr:16S rRNA pseudouridine(516) synthase [Gammaproteobacteria bacterium 45_16_T64]